MFARTHPRRNARRLSELCLSTPSPAHTTILPVYGPPWYGRPVTLPETSTQMPLALSTDLPSALTSRHVKSSRPLSELASHSGSTSDDRQSWEKPGSSRIRNSAGTPSLAGRRMSVGGTFGACRRCATMKSACLPGAFISPSLRKHPACRRPHALRHAAQPSPCSFRSGAKPHRFQKRYEAVGVHDGLALGETIHRVIPVTDEMIGRPRVVVDVLQHPPQRPQQESQGLVQHDAAIFGFAGRPPQIGFEKNAVLFLAETGLDRQVRQIPEGIVVAGELPVEDVDALAGIHEVFRCRIVVARHCLLRRGAQHLTDCLG